MPFFSSGSGKTFESPAYSEENLDHVISAPLSPSDRRRIYLSSLMEAQAPSLLAQ